MEKTRGTDKHTDRHSSNVDQTRRSAAGLVKIIVALVDILYNKLVGSQHKLVGCTNCNKFVSAHTGGRLFFRRTWK